MALPTSSISISAVKTALGTTETGVIALCQSNKCNKWSGVKPFRSSVMQFTYEDLVAALKNADHGLVPNECQSAAAALDLAAGNTEIWPYEKPLGTAASPCRLGDFRGYDHGAPVPYNASVETTKGLTGYYNPSFDYILSQSPGAGIIASEMGTLKTGKWIIIWRKLNASSANEIDGSRSVSSTSLPIHVSASPTQEGTYEACAAILRTGAGIYYPIPNSYRRFAIEITSDIAAYLKLAITVECFMIETNPGNDKWKVYMRVSVKNIGDSSISTGYQFILRESTYDVTDRYTGDVNSLAAGATTVFYPGEDTETRNFGDGNKTWGVSNVFEGFSNPNFTYSGWVNKNGGGILATFSGQAEQPQN